MEYYVSLLGEGIDQFIGVVSDEVTVFVENLVVLGAIDDQVASADFLHRRSIEKNIPLSFLGSGKVGSGLRIRGVRCLQ